MTLPPLSAEDCDKAHAVTAEQVDDEHFITVHHGMTKDHFISFLACVTTDRVRQALSLLQQAWTDAM